MQKLLWYISSFNIKENQGTEGMMITRRRILKRGAVIKTRGTQGKGMTREDLIPEGTDMAERGTGETAGEEEMKK